MDKIQINYKKITKEILTTNTCFDSAVDLPDPDLLFFENRIINELISKSPYTNINKHTPMINTNKFHILFDIGNANTPEEIFSRRLNCKDSLDLKAYRLISELDSLNIKTNEITNLMYESLSTNKKHLKKIDILNMIFPKNNFVNFNAIPYNLNYSDNYATLNGLKLFKVESYNEVLDFLRGIIRVIFFKMEKEYIEKDDSFLNNFPLEVIDTISIRKGYQNLNFLNEIKFFKSEIRLNSIIDIYDYLHLTSKEHNFIEVVHIYRWCLENLPDSKQYLINEVIKNKYNLLSQINRLLADNAYLDSDSKKFFSQQIAKFDPQNKKMVNSLSSFKKMCGLIRAIYLPNDSDVKNFLLDTEYEYSFCESFGTNTTPYFKEQLEKLLLFYFKDSSEQLQDKVEKEVIISKMKKEILRSYNENEVDSILNAWNDLCYNAVEDLVTPKITDKLPNLFIDGYFVCEKKWIYIENELLSKNLNAFDNSIKNLIEEFSINNIKLLKEKMNTLLDKNAFKKDEKYKFKKRIKAFYEKMLINIETVEEEHIKEVEKQNNNIKNIINTL